MTEKEYQDIDLNHGKSPLAFIVEIKTGNTTYTLKRDFNKMWISGNAKYCPEPVLCNIHGATLGKALQVNMIKQFLPFEYSTENHPKVIRTSLVEGVTWIYDPDRDGQERYEKEFG